MATFSFHGLDELELDMQAVAELPEDVINEMLNAQADVVLEAQRVEAQGLGMYSGYNTSNNSRDTSATNFLPGQKRSYSTGKLAKSLKKSSPFTRKGVRKIKVYFSGSRLRGKIKTSNSEIAFLNEFGTRNINARNFIWTANEKSAEATTQAAADVYDRFLKSKNL